MKRQYPFLMLFCLLYLMPGELFAQGNFFTSIHATRAGKGYWYNANTPAPAPGFETLTNAPIEVLECVLCHPADNLDANGDPYPIPYPGMNCVDCHATNSGWSVNQNDCYDCHGRQKTEAVTLGYSDVHRTANKKCWFCHPKAELHGNDGVSYNSMLQPGAIQANCQNCHSSLPSSHNNNDPHNGKLHCDACHAQSVISCYNCHFESQVQAKLKRPNQTIHDFVILANRDKDGKVGTMSFQSLTYQGNAWAAFAPYHAHTITLNGRTCTQCHLNFGGQVQAIQQYNATGEIQFTSWNSADSTLSWIHGVVPMPEDYQTSFKMDFLTYNGNPNDPVAPSKNWSYIGKSSPDGHQMFFATPLSKVQMAKLGFDTTMTGGCISGLLGDVNDNAGVNSSDALIILSYDSGIPLPQPIMNRISIGFGDVNEDDLTNSTDPLIILSWEAGFPVPYPVAQTVCLPNNPGALSRQSPKGAVRGEGEIRTYPDVNADRLRKDRVIEVPVMVDMGNLPEKLGSYTVSVKWNPSLLQFIQGSGGSTTGFSDPVINSVEAANGRLKAAHAYPGGGNGTVHILTLRFRVLEDAATLSTAPISLHFSAMAAAESFANLLPYLKNAGNGGDAREETLAAAYQVENYPNPFNPSTTIRYQLPGAGETRLVVYNTLGQQVRVLVNRYQEAGYYQVIWDGRNDAGEAVASGIYIYRFEAPAGSYQKIGKMMLLK